MARVNGITQFLPATHTTILTLLFNHSPDGTITRTRRYTSDIAYYSIYRPLKDKRLSWPSWLTYSGRLTHISGHPSAAGRAWDRKVRRSKTNVLTTVPHNQPTHAFDYNSAESEPIWMNTEYILKDWPGQILRVISAVATAGESGKILFVFCQVSNVQF